MRINGTFSYTNNTIRKFQLQDQQEFMRSEMEMM